MGTDSWAVEQAAAVLSDAGHETLTCHPPGQPAFPCNALVEGRVCPLDVGFDIVLNVRARPLDHPTVGEIGVICGLRAGAALVTAGMGGRNPFAAWGADPGARQVRRVQDVTMRSLLFAVLLAGAVPAGAQPAGGGAEICGFASQLSTRCSLRSRRGTPRPCRGRFIRTAA